MVMTRMYRVVGMMAGHLIFQNAWKSLAPSTSAASTMGLVHIAQCGDVQNDGLAHGGSQQDEDDAAQSEPLIAQPVDVLVDETERFAQIVEDAVVVVVHPLPHDGNGDRTGDDGEIEHAAEEAGGPLRQIDDGRADPTARMHR